MTHIFKPFMGIFVVVYFDDIVVYSRSIEAYLEHLQMVFEVLSRECLYANLKKRHFLTNKVVFLGYVVSNEGINVDRSKADAIKNWPGP